jgi:hypothetical protein
MGALAAAELARAGPRTFSKVHRSLGEQHSGARRSEPRGAEQRSFPDLPNLSAVVDGMEP